MSQTASGFELRDHTADIALFAWGTTPQNLFTAAAQGLYATLGDLHGTGATDPITISLEGRDREDLLVDFLSELLFLFETAQVRIIDLSFEELTETRLRSTGLLEPLDVTRCQLEHEVKAVTHHDLAIHNTPNGLETTIVLDI